MLRWVATQQQTWGSLTRTFGFMVLVWRIFVKKHAKGVSKKTLQLYAGVFVFRLMSILRHEGYLPYDKSGDFIYHLCEMASLGSAAFCLYLMSTTYAHTYQRRYDTFGNMYMPEQFGALYLFVPCVLLGLVFHPTLNNDALSDISWAISMYLESCAIVPQLFMFQRQAKTVVEVLISHSVFALGFARVMDMIFWLFSYHELSTVTGSKSVGMFVLGTQFVHIAIMGDFFYYYIISLKTGDLMDLPSRMPV